jgi:hypothetical protein
MAFTSEDAYSSSGGSTLVVNLFPRLGTDYDFQTHAARNLSAITDETDTAAIDLNNGSGQIEHKKETLMTNVTVSTIDSDELTAEFIDVNDTNGNHFSSGLPVGLAGGINNTVAGVGAGASITTAENCTFHGYNAGANIANGLSNSCYGNNSGLTLTGGGQTICLGANSDTTGPNTNFGTALGYAAETNTSGVAVGRGAIAGASGSIAVGYGSSCTHAGSVVVGNSTASTQDNEVRAGPDTIDFVRIGFKEDDISAMTVKRTVTYPDKDFDIDNPVVTSISDGTATLTGGAISSLTTVGASGTITGGTITDGTATLTSGDLSGIGTLTSTSINNVDTDLNCHLTGKPLNATGGLYNTSGGHQALAALTSGYNNTTFGAYAGTVINSGGQCTCIGYNANPTTGSTVRATAIGNDALASGNSVAIGEDAEATGANTVVVGYESKATHDGSVVVGASTISTRTNEVRFGPDTTNYVRIGLKEEDVSAMTVKRTVTYPDKDFDIDNPVVTSISDGTATLTGGAISSLTTVGASGTITGGTITDGTATLTGGAISSLTTVGASGTITGGTITDGTASLTSGAISSLTTVGASGTITGGTITDGTASLTGGNLSGVGTVYTNNIDSSGAGAVTVQDNLVITSANPEFKIVDGIHNTSITVIPDGTPANGSLTVFANDSASGYSQMFFYSLLGDNSDCLYGFGASTINTTGDAFWRFYRHDGSSNIQHQLTAGASGGVAFADSYLCRYGGNIGIGTGTPSYKLDVDGDVRAQHDLFLGSEESYDVKFANDTLTAARTVTVLDTDADIGSAFAEMYGNGGSGVTVVDTTSAVKVDQFTADGNSSNMTVAHGSDRITVNPAFTGYYQVACTISFTGSVNTAYTFQLYKNGSATGMNGLKCQRKIGTNNDVGCCSLHGIVNLSGSTDYIEVYWQTGATSDLTCEEINLTVHRM